MTGYGFTIRIVLASTQGDTLAQAFIATPKVNRRIQKELGRMKVNIVCASIKTPVVRMTDGKTWIKCSDTNEAHVSVPG